MAEKKIYHSRDFDELLTKTKLNIEKYGLQVMSVSGTEYLPSFSYSIGLLERFQHPEIICFGLKTDLMHLLLNDVAALIKQGDKIETGRTYSNILKNLDAQFLKVDPASIVDYFGLAIRYYKHEQIPAIQLVWPDQENRFPWELNYQESMIYKQPLLDRNAGFKFREAKNLGILTTRQWLDLDKPILRVVHDSDGEWQFLTGDQLPEDARLVALDEVVKTDITLNAVFNLDYGEAAERSYLGGEWTRSKFEDNEDEEIENNQDYGLEI